MLAFSFDWERDWERLGFLFGGLIIIGLAFDFAFDFLGVWTAVCKRNSCCGFLVFFVDDFFKWLLRISSLFSCAASADLSSDYRTPKSNKHYRMF